jgi:hypothetical protein
MPGSESSDILANLHVVRKELRCSDFNRLKVRED